MQGAMLRSLTGGWSTPAAGDHQAACLGLCPRPSARVTLGHNTRGSLTGGWSTPAYTAPVALKTRNLAGRASVFGWYGS